MIDINKTFKDFTYDSLSVQNARVILCNSSKAYYVKFSGWCPKNYTNKYDFVDKNKIYNYYKTSDYLDCLIKYTQLCFELLSTVQEVALALQ